jgi:hypothetical protein
VTNPATAGTYTLSVFTSKDTTPVTSPSYTVTAAKAVGSLSLAISPPSSAAGALTTYALSFVTSSTGGLAGDAGSAITVNLPAGSGLSGLTDTSVTVADTQVGDCFESTSTVAVCDIFSGDSVPPSTAVSVTLNGVTNPATAGAYTLGVSTTSDTVAVTSPSYTVTSANKIKSLSVKVSSTLTGATNVTYTVQFNTVTGLSGNAGSTIPVTFPSGSGLSGLTDTSVTVAGTQVGDCSKSTSTVAVCDIFSGDSVAAGATVVVTLGGLSTPGTTGAYTLKVSTSSDVKTAAVDYCIAASGVPCIARLAPTTGPVGTAVTITGLHLAGATAVDFNGTAATISTDTATKITTSVPAGATTGSVTVTTPGGTAASPASFTVTS